MSARRSALLTIQAILLLVQARLTWNGAVLGAESHALDMRTGGERFAIVGDAWTDGDEAPGAQIVVMGDAGRDHRFDIAGATADEMADAIVRLMRAFMPGRTSYCPLHGLVLGMTCAAHDDDEWDLVAAERWHGSPEQAAYYASGDF